MKREDSLSCWSGRILNWLLSVGILNSQAVYIRSNPHVPVGYGPRRLLCSCSGVHDAVAHTGDDIAAEGGQADRFKYPEPRGKLFRRPAEISHGPSRYDGFTREMR
jgi:hypothetical protein